MFWRKQHKLTHKLGGFSLLKAFQKEHQEGHCYLTFMAEKQSHSSGAVQQLQMCFLPIVLCVGYHFYPLSSSGAS